MSNSIPAASANGENLLRYDVFISHASEDKAAFVRPLAQALIGLGLKIWCDEATLQIGDSLSSKIDEGLACSRFGVVVLSPSFFAKQWPRRELEGLVAREVRGKKIILPVRHELTTDQLLDFSPTLADKLAVLSEHGVSAVAAAILEVVRPRTATTPPSSSIVASDKNRAGIPADDLVFYNEQVAIIIEAFGFKLWEDLVGPMSRTPPIWLGNYADEMEAAIRALRRQAWPKTVPALEAAIANLCNCGEATFNILLEHMRYDEEKYIGRAFYKDMGFNPKYDRDARLFEAWIRAYDNSLSVFVKAMNWLSDVIRENLERTFFRKEGYFVLDLDQGPPKYTPAEIESILEGRGSLPKKKKSFRMWPFV
jgi:hypothetical protein